MSKAPGASPVRRIAHLFTKTSLSSTTKSTIRAATATSTKPSSKSEKRARNRQNLVERFKKNCDSDKFRNDCKNEYYNTVRRLANMKRFSLIDDILQHQKKYQEISQEHFVIRLMLYYSYAGMSGHSKKLFDEMPELKCERTVMSFNALLSAYIHSKKFDEVDKLFKELPRKIGIEPNLVSYNTVIKAHCEMKSFASALSMVDEMEKKGIEPDVITFNTLLDGLYRNGKIADAEEIWGLMEKKNVVPNGRSYNSKMRGLVYENKISKGVELLEEMRSKGFEPEIHSYNALIKGYCNDGNLEQVKKWYGELKNNGLSPNRVTYYRLIYFLCTKDEVEMAAELCKEVIDRWGRAGASLLQRNIIDELVKDSRIEEAVQLVELGKLKFHYNLKCPRSE
ncbi:hypothetical protein CCACVL1_28018 [Corchorus capsularis]|uniref:Pentacotripeptide-repeat region of PRORP domain-containing protein n=1 Tax=Corchorus capsularis TaxID=210143 RepID=A0A1R3G7W6_COCAP|nr:hypothetical protein CCACVL1_28018 [Corchorus capsularis]